MRRSLACALFLMAALGVSGGAAHASRTAALPNDLGRSRAVEGFSVTLHDVVRAHEAGAADYVAARGKVFLLVTVQIKRQGGHGSYYADPQDFHLQTSNGDVIDSEQFGLRHELTARHVYNAMIAGTIGFEVPAADHHLLLLWQPAFSANPDAQAQWALPTRMRAVSYFQ